MLNLDDYVDRANTVFSVKGVPVFYLPCIYYPIQDDDRATGFLMPSYGTSTLRGQAISNAFFWAIGRSQDATFFHDWFTRTGQGVGAEYRYVTGPQSSRQLSALPLRQQRDEVHGERHRPSLPASDSFELTGTRGAGARARRHRAQARCRLLLRTSSRSSSIIRTSIDASSRNRMIEGGVTAARAADCRAASSTSATRCSTARPIRLVYGSTPRVTASLAPQRLFRHAGLRVAQQRIRVPAVPPLIDGSAQLGRQLRRGSMSSPSLRVPLSRLTFLSVNASAATGRRTTRAARDATSAPIVAGFVHAAVTVAARPTSSARC